MTKFFFQVIVFSLACICAPLSFANENALSQALTPNVSVTGQMTVEKFEKLVQQDFKSVIVNRPDQEIGNMTSASALRNIAEQANLSLIYQPVISGQISQQDVQEFAKYYNSLPKPILLVCKSGNRSKVLFNQARSLGLIDE
mgnify:FL=1